ncbi:queuosine precursor transporter [archaeon]|jgi:queuosine precursor transporter|nr:queuosine precursor transporter [archaeon]MBT4397250.1 queuosine precursor transporter [archaeon]MBT4440630.1 queuosine precursor transporter [archaeon]
MNKRVKIDILLAVFIAALVLANILGTKITTLFGIRVSVGIFFVPFMFLVTDIVSEVYGKKKARQFVMIAVFVLVVLFAATYLAIHLPANETWGNQEAFESIFGSSLRMIIASVIAFILSQLHDVWTFHALKKATKGKLLWLRNNISTMISQLIDTTVFMFIAFYHISPKFTTSFIISLIIPYYLFKIGFSILDTPLVYLGVRWLRGKSHLSNKLNHKPELNQQELA